MRRLVCYKDSTSLRDGNKKIPSLRGEFYFRNRFFFRTMETLILRSV